MTGSVDEKSVLINCPFDSAFEPLFHAIVLTVQARGFTARSAHETAGNADNRMDRIAAARIEILDSRSFALQLTRFRGDGQTYRSSASEGRGAERLSSFTLPAHEFFVPHQQLPSNATALPSPPGAILKSVEPLFLASRPASNAEPPHFAGIRVPQTRRTASHGLRHPRNLRESSDLTLVQSNVATTAVRHPVPTQQSRAPARRFSCQCSAADLPNTRASPAAPS
jgi:hypothetical protein